MGVSSHVYCITLICHFWWLANAWAAMMVALLVGVEDEGGTTTTTIIVYYNCYHNNYDTIRVIIITSVTIIIRFSLNN